MILIDTGPLVALVDGSDEYHSLCTEAVRGLRPPFGTVWPVVTEAMFLLAAERLGQEAIWEMIVRGSVQLLPLGVEDVPRIRQLMHKYADRPMDLADAALIAVAERENMRRIFTVDRKDFSVYRLHGRYKLSIIP